MFEVSTASCGVDLKSAAAGGGAEEYILEVRVPFEDMPSPPKAGDIWAANFYRFRPAEQAWSPTYVGFHTPTRFGKLTFLEE